MSRQHLLQAVRGKSAYVGFAIGLMLLDAVFLSSRRITENNHRQESSVERKRYSASDLAKYDGTDPTLPVLIALDGNVYDVSAGRDTFYAPGKPYHALAGTDASTLLHIAGGGIIARKYPVIGRYSP